MSVYKILCYRGWKVKSFLFPDNDFGTLAFLVWPIMPVSHFLRGQPDLLGCYYWNCLIGKHMYVHPVSELGFFTLPCELFISCNVSLLSTWTDRQGWSTKFGLVWTWGGGIPKIPKFVRTSFMDDPKGWKNFYTIIFKFWDEFNANFVLLYFSSCSSIKM